MREEQFKNWLAGQPGKDGPKQSVRSRCNRLEKYGYSLDECFEMDRGKGLLGELTCDEEGNPRHKVLFKMGVNPVEGTNSLRTAANKYMEFREAATNQRQRKDSVNKMREPLNQILCGPPGTGKTYETVCAALRIVKEFKRSRGCRAAVGDPPEDRADASPQANRRADKDRFDELQKDGRVEFVTFHQSYAYEDFIEGIRPVLDILGDEDSVGDGQGLRYELRDGIFKQIARRASENPNEGYVLIIDEINRGNVAKIFGELITLIEPSKRTGQDDAASTTLPYSNQPFSVPANLYLIGTMNTADRGIALLDTALRRRFDFVERMPDAGKLAEDVEGVNCHALLRAINERIVELLDRERQIGHTYLMGVATLDELAEAFRKRVVPLLQEYFYDDWAKLRRVLNNNAFISKRKGKVLDQDVFEVLPADDGRWRQAKSYQDIYGDELGEAEDE